MRGGVECVVVGGDADVGFELFEPAAGLEVAGEKS